MILLKNFLLERQTLGIEIEEQMFVELDSWMIVKIRLMLLRLLFVVIVRSEGLEVENKTAARGGLAFCALAGVKGSARASKS
jgi:hypothetical protein